MEKLIAFKARTLREVRIYFNEFPLSSLCWLIKYSHISPKAPFSSQNSIYRYVKIS